MTRRVSLAVGSAVALAAAGLALVRARRQLTIVVIRGSSMQPTFRPGDRVLIRSTAPDRIAKGQVVILRYPEWAGRRSPAPGRIQSQAPSWIIKRVAAVPGDRWGPVGGPVPAGWLAVVGDHGEASDDSRHFGLVAADTVLGTVVRRLNATRDT